MTPELLAEIAARDTELRSSPLAVYRDGSWIGAPSVMTEAFDDRHALLVYVDQMRAALNDAREGFASRALLPEVQDRLTRLLDGESAVYQPESR